MSTSLDALRPCPTPKTRNAARCRTPRPQRAGARHERRRSIAPTTPPWFVDRARVASVRGAGSRGSLFRRADAPARCRVAVCRPSGHGHTGGLSSWYHRQQPPGNVATAACDLSQRPPPSTGAAGGARCSLFADHATCRFGTASTGLASKPAPRTRATPPPAAEQPRSQPQSPQRRASHGGEPSSRRQIYAFSELPERPFGAALPRCRFGGANVLERTQPVSHAHQSGRPDHARGPTRCRAPRPMTL